MLRQRWIVFLLCCVVLMVLMLACSDGTLYKRYAIKIGTDNHLCDGYEWDGDDLKLYDCGIANYDKVITNASNVIITDSQD